MARVKEAVGQISLDISNPENPGWNIPDLPEIRPIADVKKTTNEIIATRELALTVEPKTKEWEKPYAASINEDNLAVIREVTHSRDANEDLIKKLVVFYGRTPISLEPAEEKRRKYSVRLNIGIIAWKYQVIDNYTVPDECDSYQILGVYNQFKGTGKVSTDKCLRKFATIQKSNSNHPESVRVGSIFFAKPKDEISVRMSDSGETKYLYKKKQ